MTAQTWPPPNGLSNPTVGREAAILSLSSSAIISAPAALAWSIITDSTTYPSWNTFTPTVKIHSQPNGTPSDSPILTRDTSFTFDAVMDPTRPDKVNPTQLRVTDVSTPEERSSYITADVLENDGTYTFDLGSVYRIAWKGEGGFAARGLRSERFTEVIVRGENECEVRTWELMGGILARTVKWFYKDMLNKRFEDWARGLRKYCEEKAKQGF